MAKILTQERGGPDHVYSLHEPQTYCIGKGNDRAKYEFDTKVTLSIDPNRGVIVGALNHQHHVYDGHVTAEARDQIQESDRHQAYGDGGRPGLPWDRGRSCHG